MGKSNTEWPSCPECGTFARTVATIPAQYKGISAVYRARKCQNRHRSLTVEHMSEDMTAMDIFLPPDKKVAPVPIEAKPAPKPKTKAGQLPPLEPVPDKFLPVPGPDGRPVSYFNGVTGEERSAEEFEFEDNPDDYTEEP